MSTPRRLASGNDDSGAGALELGHLARLCLADAKPAVLSSIDGTVGVRLANCAHQPATASATTVPGSNVHTAGAGFWQGACVGERFCRDDIGADVEQDIEGSAATRPIHTRLHGCARGN